VALVRMPSSVYSEAIGRRLEELLVDRASANIRGQELSLQAWQQSSVVRLLLDLLMQVVERRDLTFGISKPNTQVELGEGAQLYWIQLQLQLWSIVGGEKISLDNVQRTRD